MGDSRLRHQVPNARQSLGHSTAAVRIYAMWVVWAESREIHLQRREWFPSISWSTSPKLPERRVRSILAIPTSLFYMEKAAADYRTPRGSRMVNETRAWVDPRRPPADVWRSLRTLAVPTPSDETRPPTRCCWRARSGSSSQPDATTIRFRCRHRLGHQKKFEWCGVAHTRAGAPRVDEMNRIHQTRTGASEMSNSTASSRLLPATDDPAPRHPVPFYVGGHTTSHSKCRPRAVTAGPAR